MRLRKSLSPGGKKDKKQRKKKGPTQEEIELANKAKEADLQIGLLQQTGIIDAYQYFLRQAVQQGLPPNIFEFAAQKILKYEKLMKLKEAKKSQLQSYNQSIIQQKLKS